MALLLLALLAAPIVLEAFAATDSRRCCPESTAATESAVPCQYVAALGCCAQLGLPATSAGDDLRASPLALTLVAITPFPALPPVQAFAHARNGHGPPQASLLRTTVLRL